MPCRCSGRESAAAEDSSTPPPPAASAPGPGQTPCPHTADRPPGRWASPCPGSADNPAPGCLPGGRRRSPTKPPGQTVPPAGPTPGCTPSAAGPPPAGRSPPGSSPVRVFSQSWRRLRAPRARQIKPQAASSGTGHHKEPVWGRVGSPGFWGPWPVLVTRKVSPSRDTVTV